jgi:chromosome partition protein MukB
MMIRRRGPCRIRVAEQVLSPAVGQPVLLRRLLRFTNLGEHDTRTGDWGIWGRLGHPGWPSYAALDIRHGWRERVIAGVKLERKTEPSVEMEPFLAPDLPPELRLYDLLLEGRKEDGRRIDRLIDRKGLTQSVIRAGGQIRWCSVQRYY